MKITTLSLFIVTVATLNAQAFTESIDTSSFEVKKANQKIESHTFDTLTAGQFLMSKEIGQPSLPSKSYLFAANPNEIQIAVEYNRPEQIENVRPAPAVPEKCRCIEDLISAKRQFTFSEQTYLAPQALITKTYLGQFRGTPITKVDIKLVQYDAADSRLTVYDNVKVSTQATPFTFEKMSDQAVTKNYLVVVPKNWENAVVDFVEYKRSLGFNMIVETVSAPENTTTALQAKIKSHYANGNLMFAMIVGDEDSIPMFSLDTMGSSQTPSDLPYFTMDGADDHVPDVFTSRISAANAGSASEQLAKMVEQEKRNVESLGARRNIIGIASSEGYNPSDAEYVTSVNNALNAKWGGDVSYFYERNTDSNAQNLNAAFNRGAFWLTYLGHGSGYSWPSMYDYYSTEDILNINNSTMNKPVIIDVACQNGRLSVDHLGSQFMNPKQSRSAISGAAAYFGGSVNISWHPPAIMARGIAFEHMEKNFTFLGEALLAGQIYLANNWDNSDDIIDNFEWYHLQGDPSYLINY